MNRRNKILLLLLAAQIGLIAFVYRPLQQGPPAAGHALFADLAVETIQAVTISDEYGGMVRLEREEQGWLITAARAEESGEEAGLPAAELPLAADRPKVEGLLEQMSELEAVRLVSRTRAGRERLRVAEENFVRRIELSTAGGRSVVLLLGSAPSFKSVHARRGGESEVYLVEGITSWQADTEPSWWRLLERQEPS